MICYVLVSAIIQKFYDNEEEETETVIEQTYDKIKEEEEET